MLLHAPQSWSCRLRTGHVDHHAPCLHAAGRRAWRRHVQTAASCQSIKELCASRHLEDSIVVVGAGPAGLATAAALQAVGLPAVVVERGDELSSAGTALGLWTNAWRALDALQVAEGLREQHLLVDRVELCRSTGRDLRAFSLAECDGGPHEFRGVRRSNLLRALAARLAPGTLLFDCPVERVESSPQGATLELRSGYKTHRAGCLAVVGADGTRSATAPATGRGRPRYVGQTAIRGVAVYPEGVPCSVIRQVWGEGPRAGMYPISATELYWFVCFDAPAGAAGPSNSHCLREEALQQVAGWGWGVAEVIQRTRDEDLTRSRIADRWDLPRSGSGPVTLAGDALHPMTPNLGQGGCTALEDAVVLASVLQGRGVPQLLRPGGGATREDVVAALGAGFQEYEWERLRRSLPITVRSFGMGALLQVPLPPVVAARDAFVERFFSPAHFLDHATFDCGRLD